MSFRAQISDLERRIKTKVIGKRIIYEEVLDSTNSYALYLAENGEKEGTCVICDYQIRGRGRKGRSWFSPKGKNLYLSIILRPSIPFRSFFAIAFISCLSVYSLLREALSLFATLKWPNDVLVDGKKISGTLIEIPKRFGEPDFLVVGIGLNVNMRKEEIPEELKEKATSILIEKGIEFERIYLIEELLERFEKYYMMLLHEGEKKIVELWENEARIKGKRVSVRDDDRVIEGICLGLNERGALVIDVGGRIEIVNAGDVEIDASCR